MPYITVHTNATVPSKEKLVEDITTLVMSLLGKPKNYVDVIINSHDGMGFGGAREKGALVIFKSIGFSGKEAEITEDISNLVAQHLNLDLFKVDFELVDMLTSMVGKGGKLFG